MASEEEVVSIKFWAVTGIKTVKGEWGGSPGDGRQTASSGVVLAQWWQLPCWHRWEWPTTALAQSAFLKQKVFYWNNTKSNRDATYNAKFNQIKPKCWYQRNSPSLFNWVKQTPLQENQNEIEPRLHFTGQESLLVHSVKSLAPVLGKEDWKR